MLHEFLTPLYGFVDLPWKLPQFLFQLFLGRLRCLYNVRAWRIGRYVGRRKRSVSENSARGNSNSYTFQCCQ